MRPPWRAICFRYAIFVCLFLAATLSTLLYTHWLTRLARRSPLRERFRAGGVGAAAVLAPFILYDKRFGRVASRGQMQVLVRSYILRFTIFAGVGRRSAQSVEPEQLSARLGADLVRHEPAC
jgi:hypothetical protein